MLDSETFGFAIARPLTEVYEFLLEPTNFSKWAYVGGAQMRHLEGRDWAVETSVGARIIRFATRNGFGVLDHLVMRSPEEQPHPTGMWVVGNGAGTELVYTNFRRPGMTESEWGSVKAWVTTDLLALQSLLEAHAVVGPLMPARVVARSIARPVVQVYDFLADPLNFASWAFAGDARMQPVGDNTWSVETSVGPRIIRFAGRNSFGVLSYSARLTPDSVPLAIPMRVMPNAEGTQLVYVFYQRPGSTEEEWRSIIEWVSADLDVLKTILESR